MPDRSRSLVVILCAAAMLLATGPAAAWSPEVMQSIVSILPKWPGHERGGSGQVPPGTAPEGTGVAIRAGGYLVTTRHVVAKATAIWARLADGREVTAALIADDPASDLALLRIPVDLPPLPSAGEPALAAPVCAVGNQFGLGLSVTCGVVSALRRTGTGFNSVEDFIQTDATVNPGSSGGALLDAGGGLVGILSAIFTTQPDGSIGVNFAASMALVDRVIDVLMAHGKVRRVRPGITVVPLPVADRARAAGVLARAVSPGGPGAVAGVMVGDRILAVGDRVMRKPSDFVTAIQLHQPGETAILHVLRDGGRQSLRLSFQP